MQQRSFSIRAKLLTIFIAITLFSIVPLEVLTYNSTRSALIQTANQTLLAAASQAGEAAAVTVCS